MLRQYSTKRILAFFILDWLGSIFLLYVAKELRIWLGRLPEPLVSLLQYLQVSYYDFLIAARPEALLPVQVFLLVAVIWPFFLVVFSVYDGRRNQTLKAELLNVFLAICVSTVALSGLLYFSYRETPRLLILLFFVLDVVLLMGSRILWWLYRQVRQERSKDRRRVVLVIGAGPVGCTAVGQLQKYALSDLDLLGYLDDDHTKQGMHFEGLPVLGTIDQAEAIFSTHQVNDAVVALPLRAHKRLVQICDLLQKHGVHVHVIPDLFALSFPNASLDGFGGIPVIDLGRPGIHGVRRFAKRAFDVIAVSAGLIFIAPLILLIAILIKLDSPGPIIYRQKRIGENGRPFTMLKFRSMRTGSDVDIHKSYVSRLILENLSPEQINNASGSLKMEKDSRVTRVGRFIRQSSLDELPQLINVLFGEMSLVGPRPPLPYELEVYQEWHKRRLQALPGITGLWQIKGRNQVSFDEMVRMDLEYIERQSFWMDLLILIQTPAAVWSAKGAG
jgi:exopolysaccharide biosynthesis polyprenyl glycosylphosphotransferase